MTPEFSGAVAQLGERRLCKPKVAGSIPVSSISLAFRLFMNKTSILFSFYSVCVFLFLQARHFRMVRSDCS